MLKFFLKLRLRNQLLLLFLGLFFLTVLIFNYLHFLSEEKLLEIVEDEIEELSKAIQVSYEQMTAYGNTDEARLKAYLSRFKRKGVKEISIINPDQEIVASTNPLKKGTKVSISKDEFVLTTVLGEKNGMKKVYNVIVPIIVRNTKLGYAHISMYVDDLEALGREMFFKRILLTTLIFGLGVVLSYLIASRFTRPISHLIRGAREIADGRLEPFKEKYFGELSELVNAYNEMVMKLKERIEIEKQLKKSEREALLGQLAAGIAHEIRNPLNFISLSLSHLRNVPPEEQEVLITKIKEEIERINNLLNNFLNLGRELIINPVKIGIENLIEEVLTIISSKLKERGIEVIKDFSSPLPEVNIDIDKMKSCFLNILNNSIEAMPEGGKIKISIFKEDNFIVCKFADTGRGIKSDEMKHIFEPYFTTKPTGLGLGLAITQRIILAHGGSIDIESEFGKGTVVTLKLPL